MPPIPTERCRPAMCYRYVLPCYVSSQNAADQWLRRAELAVARGQDDLAREALTRRKALQADAGGLCFLGSCALSVACFNVGVACMWSRAVLQATYGLVLMLTLGM